jgi:hypothetical protein
VKEPLNLPRGTVRAVITLTLIGTAVASMFVPIIDDRAFEPLLVLCGVAVRDYFASRQEQNAQDGPQLPPPIVNGE